MEGRCMPEHTREGAHPIAVEHALDSTVVIIPSLNGKALLERMFPTLDIRFASVLVVHQGEDDGTKDLCQKLGVQIVCSPAPITFTEAANRGFEWAKKRNARYIILANNDIEFLTPVAHQLACVMVSESNVAAVAPTQVLRFPDREVKAFSSFWDLGQMKFGHTITSPLGEPDLLESDTVENTCALFDMRILDQVGFLNNDYGFYHEDVELAIRFRQAGYRSVYAQKAAIRHYVSSTVDTMFSEKKQHYIKNNTERIRTTYLRNFVDFSKKDCRVLNKIWPQAGDEFFKYARDNGLIKKSFTRLAIADPGVAGDVYLPFRTDLSENELSRLRSSYRHVLVNSPDYAERTEEISDGGVEYIPLGIDPNLFHAWPRRKQRLIADQKYILALYDTKKDLELILDAWQKIMREHATCYLLIWPKDTGMPIPAVSAGMDAIQVGTVKVGLDREHHIAVVPAASTLQAAQRADLYKTADCFIVSNPAVGACLPVYEAMACETPTVLPVWDATATMVSSGLSIPLRQATSTCVEEALLAFLDSKEDDLQEMVFSGRQFIVNNHTLRHTMFALMAFLADRPVVRHFWRSNPFARLFPGKHR